MPAPHDAKWGGTEEGGLVSILFSVTGVVLAVSSLFPSNKIAQQEFRTSSSATATVALARRSPCLRPWGYMCSSIKVLGHPNGCSCCNAINTEIIIANPYFEGLGDFGSRT